MVMGYLERKNRGLRCPIALDKEFLYPAIFNGGRAGGGGEHIVSPLSVRPSVRPVPSVPCVTQIVSVRYLLKRLVYWIEILYTGI